MRIIPEADGVLDSAERAAWLTIPFDSQPPSPEKNGAPTICNLNSFEPANYMKTPRGDMIICNGIDPPRLWDGYLPSAWLAGIAAPASAPTVTASPGGNAKTGQYACYYRFLDPRSQPSSLSPLEAVTANAGDKFSWTFLPATSSDGRVSTLELWRSIVVAIGTPQTANVVYRVATITDQTQTTYVDTLSDDDLINAAIADTNAVMEILNPDGSLNANRFTPPPRIKKVPVFYQARAFYMADVAYTKGAVNVTNGSKTVVGVGAGWTDSFIGDWFYGIGAPAGYEIGAVAPDTGPVSISIAGNAATDCVQTISFPNQPTAGTWAVSCGAASVSGLAFNISAAGLQAALDGLATIGPSGCTVSGSVAAGFTVTFQNQNAAKPMPTLVADGSLLKGTSTIAVARTQAGGGGSGDTVDQIQVVGFSLLDNKTGSPDAALPAGAAAGTWTAEFRGQGVGIPVHEPGGSPNQMATSATVQAAMQSISSIGTGNCTVTALDTLPFAGTGQILYQVEFTGALGGQLIQDYITAVTTAVGNNAIGVATITPQAYLIQEGGSTGGGNGAINEIQTITLPAGTAGGTFTISPSGCTTGSIAFNASAAAVETALAAACGDNFTVTGNEGGPWTVEFTGLLAGHPQPLMTCDSSSLLGVAITVAVTTPGAAAQDCVQNLNLGGATGGTFTLTFGANTTPALAFNITAAQLQTALEALASIGSGNVLVTGSSGVFRIEFTHSLGDAPQPALVCTTASLTNYGGTSTVTLLEPYGGPTAQNVIYCIRPAPEERNQIYFSENGEPESVPAINTLRIQQFTNIDDEVVGGMIHGPFMFVLMSHHIVRFSYDKLPALDGNFSLAAQRGAFSTRCWDYVDDTAFLMDDEGAYMFDGSEVEPISQQIEDLWRSGAIDFSQLKQFWVRAHPMEETVRFGVCFAGDTYPQTILCYNYRQKCWWQESLHQPMGTAVMVPVNSRRQLLFGGQADQFFLGDGYADGVDSNTETGTLTGTVTSATSNTLTDTLATFTLTMVGSPVAIIAGTGKGQLLTVKSQTPTTLTFSENWTTVPDPSSVYLVGAVKWTYRTGILRLAPPDPTKSGYTPAIEALRQLRMAWKPTTFDCRFDIRKYFNHSQTAETNVKTWDFGNGLTTVVGDTDIVQQMMSLRNDGLGQTTAAQGSTLYRFDGSGEDAANPDRWVTVELEGFQAREQVIIYSIEIRGVD